MLQDKIHRAIKQKGPMNKPWNKLNQKLKTMMMRMMTSELIKLKVLY